MLLHEAYEVCCRHGAGEEEALVDPTVAVFQEGALGLGFHPFGDDCQLQGFSQGDDGGDDGPSSGFSTTSRTKPRSIFTWSIGRRLR